MPAEELVALGAAVQAAACLSGEARRSRAPLDILREATLALDER